MKANELMIGDYVYNHRNWECPIVEIHKNSAVVIARHYGEEESLLSDLRPIPLTPDILEKNGWKRELDKTYYMVKYDLGKEGKNCWMMWNIKEHNLDVQRQDEKLDIYNLKVSRVVIPCNYVHELQHALRLCGIEKEFEL